MIRYLAESENYKVTSEYEYATLHFKNKVFGKSLYIGDFYGDPDCAIISRDEKYLVVAGCGLIIYRLKEPFTEYSGSENSTQYSEFFREPENIWWISELHQTDSDIDWKYFRFVSTHNDVEFIYKMNADVFGIEKIISYVEPKQDT